MQNEAFGPYANTAPDQRNPDPSIIFDRSLMTQAERDASNDEMGFDFDALYEYD